MPMPRGLSVYAASNGTFLEFRPDEGPVAAVHLEGPADYLDPVTQESILNWCKEWLSTARSSGEGIEVEGPVDITDAGEACSRCGTPVLMGVRRTGQFQCLSCVAELYESTGEARG